MWVILWVFLNQNHNPTLAVQYTSELHYTAARSSIRNSHSVTNSANVKKNKELKTHIKAWVGIKAGSSRVTKLKICRTIINSFRNFILVGKVSKKTKKTEQKIIPK